MRYYFEHDGRWSGGGSAFLLNAEHATARHDILQGGPAAGTPIVARNVPATNRLRREPFIIAPQNAWPWVPIARGPHERLRVLALRAASEVFIRRATAMLRISGAIPPAAGIPVSGIIHNPLDPGFEGALATANDIARSPFQGAFVSIGSGYSYRDLPALLRGYAAYRRQGGTTPLVIASPSASRRARTDATREGADLDGVRFIWEPLDRASCLAAYRDAAGVVLPSRVEASPFSALEACALTERVVLSDILGHREIMKAYDRGDTLLTRMSEPRAVAAVLAAVDEDRWRQPSHTLLAQLTQRERAREEWGNQVASWLETLPAASVEKEQI